MTARESRVASVVLAMLAVAIGLLLWGMRTDNAAARLGPMRTFAADGREHLAVFHAGRLDLLDANGRLIARQALAELTLADEPTDMDWTVDDHGVVQAWFFEDTLPRIVRCRFAAERQRLESCAQLAGGASLKVDARSLAVHLAVDVARERLFVADAKGHAVRALAFDGRVLGESAQGDLFFPNRLRLAGDRLVVADNDHRRLAWLDIGDAVPNLRVRRTLQASVHPQAREGHMKVTDVAFGGSGALWMLAVAQGQKHGDVLVWDEALHPVARADLGGHADPLALDRLGDAAVVADFNGVALYRIGADGRFLGAFGDAAIERELGAARHAIAAAALWTKAGWAALALTIVVGFLLAWRYSEKPGQQQLVEAFAGLADVAAEIPRGTVDLAPLAQVRRRAVRGPLVAGVLWLLAVGATFAFFAYELPPGFLNRPRFWLLMAVVPVALLAQAAVAHWRFDLIAARLVLAKGHAQVWRRGRMVASAPVRDVVASPHSLLIERTIVPYRQVKLTGGLGSWVYDEDQLTRYLIAHLPQSQRIRQHEMGRAVMRRQPAWQHWALGLAIAAFLGWQFWTAFR